LLQRSERGGAGNATVKPDAFVRLFAPDLPPAQARVLAAVREQQAAAIVIGYRGLSGLRARLEGTTSKAVSKQTAPARQRPASALAGVVIVAPSSRARPRRHRSGPGLC
jgi:nucleotide-binding universal stress UspA family protein